MGKVDLAVSFLVLSVRSEKDIKSKITRENRGYPILAKIGGLFQELQVARPNRF